MAVVNLVSYGFVDEYGNRARTTVPLSNTATLAQIQAYSDNMAATFDDVSGARITDASVTVALTLPGGLKGVPVVGVDVRKGGNAGFVAANTNYRHTIRIPGILESLLVGNQIDDTATEYTAWLNSIITGDGTLNALDKYGNDLTGHIDSLATFRK